MKLLKSKKNEYYPLIFPSAVEGQINWALTAKKYIESNSRAYDSFINVLKEELGITGTKDEMVEKYVAYQKDKQSQLIAQYINSGFDIDFFVWNEDSVPSYLLFDNIYTSDIRILQNNPKIKRYLSSQNKEQSHDSVEGSMEFMVEIFSRKLIAIQYEGDVDEEDKITKEDLINDIKENGVSVADSQVFGLYIQALMNGAVVKKKTLTSSVE